MKFIPFSFTCVHPFFVYFRKHFCPNCGNKLQREKVTVLVHSASEEAKNYDFDIADTTVKGYAKFIHLEFLCPVCDKNYTVREAKKGKF